MKIEKRLAYLLALIPRFTLIEEELLVFPKLLVFPQSSFLNFRFNVVVYTSLCHSHSIFLDERKVGVEVGEDRAYEAHTLRTKYE